MGDVGQVAVAVIGETAGPAQRIGDGSDFVEDRLVGEFGPFPQGVYNDGDIVFAIVVEGRDIAVLVPHRHNIIAAVVGVSDFRAVRIEGPLQPIVFVVKITGGEAAAVGDMGHPIFLVVGVSGLEPFLVGLPDDPVVLVVVVPVDTVLRVGAGDHPGLLVVSIAPFITQRIGIDGQLVAVIGVAVDIALGVGDGFDQAVRVVSEGSFPSNRVDDFGQPVAVADKLGGVAVGVDIPGEREDAPAVMEKLADPTVLRHQLQAAFHRSDLGGITALVAHRQVVPRALFLKEDRGAVLSEDLDVTGAEIDALVERIGIERIHCFFLAGLGGRFGGLCGPLDEDHVDFAFFPVDGCHILLALDHVGCRCVGSCIAACRDGGCVPRLGRGLIRCILGGVCSALGGIGMCLGLAGPGYVGLLNGGLGRRAGTCRFARDAGSK